MKISILTKLLAVVMLLAIVPLAVLGVLAIMNISDMEDTAIDEVDNMSSAVSTSVSENTAAVSAGIEDISNAVTEGVSDVTTTAVDDAKAALNDLGVALIMQQSKDVARQVEIYIEQNPTVTTAELQGDTYLIFETPDAKAPIYAGVHYGTNDSAVLSLEGPLAIAERGKWNRFVDKSGAVVDLAGKWIVNASDGTAGFIESNTASTVTATPAGPPGAVFDWDSGDPYFWSIAIQPVGGGEEGGYTVLCDGATGVPKFHPSPIVVNLPDQIGRQMYPQIYAIMDKSTQSGEPSQGFFDFAATQGAEPKERFSVFYPVKDANGQYVKTADGLTFMVSVAAFLETFNAPTVELQGKLTENAAAIQAELVGTTSEIETGLTQSAESIESDLKTNRNAVAGEISDAKDKTQTSTIIVIVIMVVVVAAVSFLFGRSVTNPIKRLTKAAEQVSTGNMDVRVDVKSNDEIGDLADSFGRMIATVKFLSSEEEEGAKEEEAATASRR
ncbi:MAG: HAMP domain-containing protein [Chloroflexi bacterium]|nr:HAMP domain-containing protein [Chloroflexota bacterium]